MASISFDVEVAKEITVEGAIILNHIYFWVRKNQINGKNFHKGKYWTYNSCKGFADYFQCITERVVSLRLKKLEDDGYIQTGTFSKSMMNRTKWYTLTEKGLCLLNHGCTNNMSKPTLQTVKTDITDCENTYDGMSKHTSQTVETDFTDCENYNRYKTITDTEYTDNKQTDRNTDSIAPAREEVDGSADCAESHLEKPQTGIQDQRFLEFWQAYPKKQGKGAAERAWKKIRPDRELCGKMLDALSVAKISRQWQRDNGQYIPNPATWLNQRRWEDEPVQIGAIRGTVENMAIGNPQMAMAARAMEMIENGEY